MPDSKRRALLQELALEGPRLANASERGRRAE